MYSKCGSIEDVQWVFDDMPEKTTVGWNSIIAGYALHGYSEEALSMFYEVRDSGVKMDHFTFSMIIRICCMIASVGYAKQAHAGLIRYGFGLDIVANTALVDFYSKWGRIEYAKHFFDRMACKNTISWNAVIARYGNHGRGAETVELFEQMLREKMRPNHVTFLDVLSAGSYSRLSERGWEIFQSMSRDHKIKPRAMHYACMIELLGQDRLLDEAFTLIRAAPFNPTANMLKEAATVLQTLRRKNLQMLPVRSWIEVNKQSRVFLPGDKSHDQTDEIYRKVDSLVHQISNHNYDLVKKTLLPDVDEQEHRVLLYHSEKLAVAFSLLNTTNGPSLQIVHSHRICNGCHNAIKMMALVDRRQIVTRDASRFNHFKHGSCSCGDYW
ncbi:Pentatricopeptide repeat-containing protein [Hibiscus syriacus]|uniref:Pentatricopeptide repeat-containing protein n=1 Tax=Hibiscus syriacus TaxID=106335 RepID=A0A6A2WFP1_HIBSY|nr:Pentatricopeptide repeat-containing protein [Hibiscus syriacus]